MSVESTKPICWVITGAGHFLEESIEVMASLAPVHVFLSRAAVEVVALYKLTDRLSAVASQLHHETGHSAMPSIYFAGGRYRSLVLAPATANTVAKCSLGIADSLASSFFAQANKSRVHCIVLPTDLEPEMITKTSSGRLIPVYPRPVDLAHVDALRRFPGVTICSSPSEIRSLV